MPARFSSAERETAAALNVRSPTRHRYAWLRLSRSLHHFHHPSGEASATLTLAAIDDAAIEIPEDATVIVSANANYIVDSTASAASLTTPITIWPQSALAFSMTRSMKQAAARAPCSSRVPAV